MGELFDWVAGDADQYPNHYPDPYPDGYLYPYPDGYPYHPGTWRTGPRAVCAGQTLESARSIQSPSMGLLRRPTLGEIVEGGRLGRPYGPGAHSRASQKTNLRLRRHSTLHRSVSRHVPKRRPVSVASAVSTVASALRASVIWCVPSAMRHLPAVPSKRPSSGGSAVTVTCRDSLGRSSIQNRPQAAASRAIWGGTKYRCLLHLW
jgi:hypothetical protein